MRTSSDGKWQTLLGRELLPAPFGERELDRIGSVRCLGEVIEDGRAYLAYEYDLSRGPPKIPISHWKVLIDRTTATPVKFWRRTDGLEEVETRTYEPGLKVEPPSRLKTQPAAPVEPKR